MIIQHNISAINSHRLMGINNKQTSGNLEKLSSGYRINRAADDAAGLAISEKMRGQIRGLDMAEQNTSNAINLIQTAEGALAESQDILQRMRELAVQSSNGTYQDVDRQQITKEYEALKSEIDRIAESTHYNNIKLLNGNLNEGVQANVTDNYNMITDATFNAANSSGDAFEINLGTYKAAVVTAPKATQITAAMTTSTAAVTKGGAFVIQVGALQFEGTWSDDHAIGADAARAADIAAAIQGDSRYADLNFEVSTTGTSLKLTAKEAGAKTIDDFAGQIKLLQSDGTTAYTAANAAIAVGTLTTAGADESVTDATLTGFTVTANGTAITGTATYDYDKKTFTISDTRGNSFTIAESAIMFNNQKAVVNLTTGENLTFQIGANGGQDQRVNLGVANMDSKHLGLKAGVVKTDGKVASASEAATVHSSSIGTILDANKAIEIVEAANIQISGQRSELGALQNRLESTMNSLGVSKENLTAAESTIRDVDMAEEMMDFVKNQILVQASQAMLAQANQLPQGVLNLLR